MFLSKILRKLNLQKVFIFGNSIPAYSLADFEVVYLNLPICPNIEDVCKGWCWTGPLQYEILEKLVTCIGFRTLSCMFTSIFQDWYSTFSPQPLKPKAHSPSPWQTSHSNLNPHFQKCMENDVTMVWRSLINFRQKPSVYS